MSDALLEAIRDGVAVVSMNRPDRLNALSRPMLDALLEARPGWPRIPPSAWWCSRGRGAPSAPAAM